MDIFDFFLRNLASSEAGSLPWLFVMILKLLMSTFYTVVGPFREDS